MEKIKATLSRKVGPFAIGVWLIIIVAGVALGLIIKRAIGGDITTDVSGLSAASNPDATTMDYGPSTTYGVGVSNEMQSSYDSLRAEVIGEQSRWQDEIASQLDEFFTSLSGSNGGGSNGSGPIVNVPADTIPEQLQGLPTSVFGRLAGAMLGEPDTVPWHPSEVGSISYFVQNGDTHSKVAGFFATHSGIAKATVLPLLQAAYPILTPGTTIAASTDNGTITFTTLVTG